MTMMEKYPHYVDHIIEEASEKYGLNANEILAGGYSIYTELNPTMQEATEKTYANNRLFPNSPSDQLVQSSAVFVNPSTGGIQALIGGRGEHTFRQFNRATQLKTAAWLFDEAVGCLYACVGEWI
ncbi:hypothetical protein GCM10020331_083970 [Ectobacillus funiculus]